MRKLMAGIAIMTASLSACGVAPESAESTHPASAAVTLSPVAVTDVATCDFLRAELSTLREFAGSDAFRQGLLATNYFFFVREQPGVKMANAADLDEITALSCPQVRADVLEVLNLQKFAGVL